MVHARKLTDSEISVKSSPQRTLVQQSQNTQQPQNSVSSTNSGDDIELTSNGSQVTNTSQESEISSIPVSSGQLRFEVVEESKMSGNSDQNFDRGSINSGSKREKFTEEGKKYAENVKENTKKFVSGAKEKLGKIGVESFGRELNSPGRKSVIEQIRADQYFANRQERLYRAEQFITLECLDPQQDGSLVALYVLTMLDSWNHETERVVALNQRSICVINYDFITEKLTTTNNTTTTTHNMQNRATGFNTNSTDKLAASNCAAIRRVPYSSISKVILGPIYYPEKSLLSQRHFDCVKLIVSASAKPKNQSLWKPFNSELPWLLLTSHPLAGKISGNRGVYQIEVMHQTLTNIVTGGTGLNFPNIPLAQIPTTVTLTTSNINTKSAQKSQIISSNIQEQNGLNSGLQTISQTSMQQVSQTTEQISLNTQNITKPGLTPRQNEDLQSCLNSQNVETQNFTSPNQNRPEFVQEPILMETYFGLTAAIFNQSKLAFAMDRNGISF